jgi:DNA gyrase subunit B
MTAQYGADNITVLEGLEAVRKRPAMYIGNTGSEGLHKCFSEIVDNSVDEMMGGYATEISTSIMKDNSVIVSDNGRGIPVDIHTKTGKPALETILTVLHAGGKFDQNSYEYSGGLHGVGASVVNALSSYLACWVLRDNNVYHIEFSRGKTVREMEMMTLEEFGTRYPQLASRAVWKKTGTITKFQLDTDIFEIMEFDSKLLSHNLRQTAYLAAGLKINFEDEKLGVNETFHTPDGLKTYLEDLTKNQTLITPLIHFKGKDVAEKFELEVILAYSANFQERLFAYTNLIENNEGGMHVTGFRTAMTRIFNKYATDKGFFKKGEKFDPNDIREGFNGIISVKMVDPQFTSQAKVKLGSTIARKITDRIASENLESYFEENPKVAAAIMGKAQLAMKARLAAASARQAVQRKDIMTSMALPGKLADCSSKDPSNSELYLVEGDSAGGTAKTGRDRHTQAILPLRGKVLNTERASLDRIMNYEGIKNMIIALGTGIQDTFDITKLRYHKIVLMTDADVDGAHITTLLLTFFYRYMPQLVDGGFVYLARPPLFKVSWGKNKFQFVYSVEERDGVMEREQTLNSEKTLKFEIQRYKGLGEMNADQLWDTTMDPATRMLYQVTVGDVAVTTQVFSDLMGEDVEPRRRFIEENAKFAELDL